MIRAAVFICLGMIITNAALFNVSSVGKFINKFTSPFLRSAQVFLGSSEDAHLSIAELVHKYGYPFEVHTVTTEDGYILELHRIPHGRTAGKHKRAPVLIVHGLLLSSDDWIVSGPGKGLGYVYADAGYDVWLGNVRGNKHSKSHVRLSSNDAEFWKFQIDEIGLYDLPAMIDYVLEKTNENQLFYVGFSQGTTSIFMLCSSRPEYNKKIRFAAALAPVSERWHVISPVMILLFSQASNIERILLALFGTSEFPPLGDVVNTIGELICGNQMITQVLCAQVYFLIGGYDPQQLNSTMLPVIYGHFPSSCSVGQLMQFWQILKRNQLTHFDFGKRTNARRYGKTTPPVYDLRKVTAPIFLMYGNNDWLALPVGVEDFHRHLRNVVDVYYVKNERFTHLDFVWGTNAKELVYDVALQKMKKY